MVIKCVVFILFSFFILVVVSKNSGTSWEKDFGVIIECFDMIKKSLPYIFTIQKKILLIIFFFFCLFKFDYKYFVISNYFSVSLTALSLLLTTSNISRNFFGEEKLKNINPETWKAYLGKFIFTALIWFILNILSLTAPLISNLNGIIYPLYLELLFFAILMLFDLLVTIIRLYKLN